MRRETSTAMLCTGGAVRVVLELAGVRNCFGKQLGSANQLNNARATIEGLRNLRTFKMVLFAYSILLSG
jgi:small subunit ribosomal protein S5